MKRTATRLRGRALGLGVMIALVCAPSALAYTYVWYEGPLSPSDGTILGPRHTLTETSIRVLDSWSTGCTTAYDLSYNRVGEPFCTSGYMAVAAHPYCGCALRYPAASSSGGFIRAREDYA